MKKPIRIITTVSQKTILEDLNKIVEKPTINVLDIGINKKYTGEIDENEFWFTWSKTLNLLKSRPIVKGEIKSINNKTSINLKIKDNSNKVLFIFAFIFLIPIVYFSTVIISNQEYKSLFIPIGFILLISIILTLNNWKTKNGMSQIEKEIYRIFDY